MNRDKLCFSQPNSVTLHGRLGEQLRLSTRNRIMAQNVTPLIKAYQDYVDSKDKSFRGEYWGKWSASAILCVQNERDASLEAEIHRVADAIISTQSADGYIGTVAPADRLSATYDWDVWCRTYVLFGLIEYYNYTGDSKVLQRARRFTDLFIADILDRQINVSTTGISVLKGLASSCILEPIALLYQHTQEPKYLSFAKRLISEWDVPNDFTPNGLQLVNDALACKPPIRNHAYATMSCFEGVCEFYRATGEKKYLDAAVNFAETVLREERMVHGSVSNQELFCGGAKAQTETLEQPAETCATVTWMRLCTQLLRLTSDSRWADELELSLYNALTGAQVPSGEWWSYYSPLIGERVPSQAYQEDVELSCCVANGPRGLQLTPRWAIMTGDQAIYINLYTPSESRIRLPSGEVVTIKQETSYPRDSRVELLVSLDRPANFTLALRMPTWSNQTKLSINGESVASTPGTYVRIQRLWTGDSHISLDLDLRGRIVKAPSGGPELAVMRGPLVLALDNRHCPDHAVAVWLSADPAGFIDLVLNEQNNAAWVSCSVKFEVKPSHFFDHYTLTIPMIDYSSAGNAWGPENILRVWLPQPLYLPDAFPKATWKVMYPARTRPVIPASVESRVNT